MTSITTCAGLDQAAFASLTYLISPFLLTKNVISMDHNAQPFVEKMMSEYCKNCKELADKLDELEKKLYRKSNEYFDSCCMLVAQKSMAGAELAEAKIKIEEQEKELDGLRWSYSPAMAEAKIREMEARMTELIIKAAKGEIK